MIELNWSYIAGLFDGEGYIGLHKHKDSRVKIGFTINAMVGITSTNKSILKLVRKSIPFGKIRVKTEVKYCKPVYELLIQDLTGIEGFLTTIKDDLVLKKKRAEIMLKFCELRKINYNYTPAQMILVNRIRKLNQRGRDKDLGILPNFI